MRGYAPTRNIGFVAESKRLNPIAISQTDGASGSKVLQNNCEKETSNG